VSDRKKQEGKTLAEDSQRTLITLDQLSQTIEVMSSVVNRLRAHLSEQVAAAIKPSSSHSQPLCNSSTSEVCAATGSDSRTQTPAHQNTGSSTTLSNSNDNGGSEKPEIRTSLVVELTADVELARDPRVTLH
jgi:Tfp pilus assembly protein FimT